MRNLKKSDNSGAVTTIGLVLASLPAYSETFFRTKIKYLKESSDFDVIVFSDSHSKQKFDLCEVFFAPNFSIHSLIAFIQRTLFVVLTFYRSPKKVIKLIRLYNGSNLSLNKILVSIIKSGHIIRHKIDVLHFGYGTMALGREHLAHVMGAKLAVSFRGFDIAIYPLKQRGCYSLLWKTVDVVHVISDDLATLLYREGLSSEISLRKITPAIDIEKFKIDQIKPKSSLLKLVTVCRLHWKKGLEYTLEALAILKESNLRFHYTVIGEGEERERLIYAVHQLGLQDQVTFAGRCDQNAIIELLKSADLYLQYSIQEGFCNAVLEAQAMGLLCIVSDAEGLPENVLHNYTGWVVPKRKPALLANRIHEVSKLSDEKALEVRLRAIERVKAEFNIDKQCNEFRDFYLCAGLKNS
ncbi:MAG: glycosyltransferase family 4 protein [Cyclobacteriaceae bacterium]|nr:glycosyltransferase family 4 protein [Cyclobacteriaceae bacterium]